MEYQTTTSSPPSRRRLPGGSTRFVILLLLALFVVAGSALGQTEGPAEQVTTPVDSAESTPTTIDIARPTVATEALTDPVASSLEQEEVGPGLIGAGLESDGEAAFVSLDEDRPGDAAASAPGVGQPEAGVFAADCAQPDGAPTSIAGTDPARTIAAPWYGDTFEADAVDWQPLSGNWVVQDGRYVQRDAAGYDLIAELRVDPPPQYRVGVDIDGAGDGLGAGLVVGQPIPGSRAGAVVIDFTDGGSFLRWGSYDPDTGQYRYIGGLAMGETFVADDGHRLEVEVRTTRTVVAVDGVEVGAFDPVGFGRIGLVTSVSSVGFDNFVIEEIR